MDVYHSVPFIHKFFQICGYSQISFDKKSKQCTRTLLYLKLIPAFMVLFSFVEFFIGDAIIDRYFNKPANYYVPFTTRVINIFGRVFLWLAQLTMFVESLLSSETEMYEALANIDSELVALGPIGKSYLKSRRMRLVWLSVGYLSMATLLAALNLSLIYLTGDYTYLVIASFMYTAFIAISFRYYQFCVTMFIINTQFDRLTRSMERTTLDITYYGDKAKRNSISCSVVDKKYEIMEMETKERNYRSLLSIQDIYDQLWAAVELASKNFEYSLFANIVSDFYCLILQVFWIVRCLKMYAMGYELYFFYLGSNLTFFSGSVLNIFTLAVLSQGTIDMATSMRNKINLVKIESSNPEHLDLIEKFSHQLLQKRIIYSVLGILEINAKIIIGAFGVVFTYLVIMFQVCGFS